MAGVPSTSATPARLPQLPSAHHLRETLLSAPRTCSFRFTPHARDWLLTEAFASLFGDYVFLFLPPHIGGLGKDLKLSTIQREEGNQCVSERRGGPCGHVFSKGESVYRCKNCAADDSCVFCSRCFHATDHTDHDTTFSINSGHGNCCDCGDPEAWKCDVHCPFHSPTSSDRPESSSSPLSPSSTTFPPGFVDAVSATIATAIDFIIETLEWSPAEHAPPTDKQELLAQPRSEQDIRENRLTTSRGDEDDTMGMAPEAWAVVLWNDEKHSFPEVIQQVVDATGCEESRAKGVADRVHEHGRDIVEVSSDIQRLLSVARIISHIDLAVTVRSAYQTFQEETAGMLIGWLQDLASSTLYVGKDAPSSDAYLLRSVVAEQLLKPWRPTKEIHRYRMSEDFFNLNDATKLDALVIFDRRMWKEARLTLRDVYTRSMSGLDARLRFGINFERMYPRMVEEFILHDREPEMSVSFFTVQLFTVPSVAVHLVREHGFLERLLTILRTFFTNQISERRFILPPPPNAQVSSESMGYRHKRYFRVFDDLKYLLSAPGVRAEIARNSEHLEHFLDFISLFNSINPNERAVTQHVEYESDLWVHVFNTTVQLAKACRQFGESYAAGNSADLKHALLVTVGRIYEAILRLHVQNPVLYPPTRMKQVHFGFGDAPGRYCIVDFVVDRSPVSFHHPMHWLLAEQLKHVNMLTSEAMQALGFEDLKQVLERQVGGFLQVVFDYPIRVCVMLAQIKAGLWVRNGLAIRGQQHHYRENALREWMYDQDLYLVQASLVVMDPNLVLVTLLDRFSLLEWFSDIHETDAHPVYQEQTAFMLEEFLFLLITCLSEEANAGAWSTAQAIQREVVHGLALGQSSYSELLKRIPERLTSDAAFDRVLTEVAKYRPPDGTADVGIYELHEEYYDQVEPFFYHYSRNQREEAEQIVKRHIAAKTGAKDPVIVPKRLDIPVGPFSVLGHTYRSQVLLQVLFFALANVAASKRDIPDSLVDETLHLIMRALIEEPDRFAPMACQVAFARNETLVALLCSLEVEPKFKPFKPKISWILDEMTREMPADVAANRRQRPSAPAVQDTDPRREAAKARQAAIMQKFAAQQKDLLDAFGEDEDDMEDVEDEEVSQKKTLGSCILCQEELDDTRPFGMLASIQPSRLIRSTPIQKPQYLQECVDLPLSLDRNNPVTGRRVMGQAAHNGASTVTMEERGFPKSDHHFGLHASACGHMMHYRCFETYCRSIEQRQLHQVARNHPENLQRHEFLCPLCKSLGNVILPVHEIAVVIDEAPLSDWVRRISIDILKSSSPVGHDYQETQNGTGSFTPWFLDTLPPFHSRAQGDPAMQQVLDRLLKVVHPIASQTKPVRAEQHAGNILAPPSLKLYLPEELCAYTIASYEIAQRGMSPPNADACATSSVADSIPASSLELLKSLLGALRQLAVTGEAGERGLAVMRQGLLKRLHPQWGGDDSVRHPLLLRDPLTMLIETAVIAPEAIGHVTSLMYYVTLVQVIFGLAQPGLWPTGAPGVRASATLTRPKADADADAALSVFADIRWIASTVVGYVGYARGNLNLGFDHLDDATLAKLVYSYTLPFLRRAAILHRVVGARFQSPPAVTVDAEASEYARLLSALRVPPPAETLSPRAERQSTVAHLLEGWTKHAYAQLSTLFRPTPLHFAGPTSNGSGGYPAPFSEPTLRLEHPHVYELLSLPKSLSTLLEENLRRTCKQCQQVPTSPAVCLLCGELLCHQSSCCADEENEQRMECNRHMDECGGAVGIYFDLKKNVIFYLFADNGAFSVPPYLDIHGEVDFMFRRGRPQYLHQQRYDEIRKTWLSHGIGTYVARKIESMLDAGGWTTF